MKADFVRRGSRLSLRPWFSRAPRGNGFFFRFFSRGRFLTPNPRMLLAGEKSIREVIAFGKTTAAQDLMAESPSEVDPVQLDQLGIALKREAKATG